MSVKFGRHLLQMGDSQMIGGAHIAFVVATVDIAMDSPRACALTVIGVAVSRKAPELSHKADRGERGKPVKPLR